MKIKIGERKNFPLSKLNLIAQVALQLPLVLQPPLPAHVFLPLVAPQPPCPLQLFLPWQSCLPASALGAFVPGAGAFVTALSDGVDSVLLLQPLLARQPATMPVIAAATRTAR
jgi:hypothetical protein